jgi:putative addiction module killer protein
MAGLHDIRARAKIAARIDRMALGNPDDAESAGEGVSRLRIHYGLGYQVYFIRRRVIMLLCVCDSRSRVMLARTFPAKSEPASCR